MTIIRPVGDQALLVEFGDRVNPDLFDQVLALDHAINAAQLVGIVETVPAYASLLIRFDPFETDGAAVRQAIERLISAGTYAPPAPAQHVVPVCYEAPYAPDSAEAAERLGITSEALAARHAEGDYRVYMYGFAPGYAYMGGVPSELVLPRKPEAVRGHFVGSVMIAAGQCLITTLPMPTGWWVIGRTALPVLDLNRANPFLFQPGDHVTFVPISASALEASLADG